MIAVTYGYARVSKADDHSRNLATQLRELEAHGIRQEHVFTDEASGRTMDRPGWRELMSRVQSGDTVVVAFLDRFSRNFEEGVAIQADLTRRDIAIVAVREQVDTREGSAAANFFRRAMLAQGAYQVESASERIGRPPALSPEQVEQCRRMAEERVSQREIARVLNCSPSTVKKVLEGTMSDTNRAPAVYRQDLFLARQVIGQLREQALESGEPFDVGYRPLDAAALDALWEWRTPAWPARRPTGRGLGRCFGRSTMTTRTDRIAIIFQDARDFQADALEMLPQSRIRNAAEKAWGATKRATDALVLARTGEEPERSSESSTGLRMLESLDPEIRRARLVRRYYTRQGHLHGDCFYVSLCEPIDETERRIRETAGYIDDTEMTPSGWRALNGWTHNPPRLGVSREVPVTCPLTVPTSGPGIVKPRHRRLGPPCSIIFYAQINQVLNQVRDQG